MRGVVKKVVVDKGFGFIEVPDEVDLFFHRTALMGLDWDETLRSRRVEFDTQPGPDGRLRAVRVRATN